MVKSIVIGAAAAGALGLAALGVGSGVANAAPGPSVVGSSWAEHPGWGWGPRHWGPPPPPPPYYGGVGWGYGPPQVCATGPLHLVQTCI